MPVQSSMQRMRVPQLASTVLCSNGAMQGGKQLHEHLRGNHMDAVAHTEDAVFVVALHPVHTLRTHPAPSY